MALVEPYLPARGGIGYIVKGIGDDGCEWDYKNVHLFAGRIHAELKSDHASLRSARRWQDQISSAPMAPDEPRRTKYRQTPTPSACDSRQAARQGVLLEFRGTELHKPVYIPPIRGCFPLVERLDTTPSPACFLQAAQQPRVSPV